LNCAYEFYACPNCGEPFAQSWQLASHMRSHKRKRADPEELAEELRALREIVEEILAGQRLILARLQALEELLARAEVPLPSPPREPIDEVPEFAKNNPWVKLLADRDAARGG